MICVSEACPYLVPRCGVKAKYVFIEKVFGSKDRVRAKENMGKCFINWKTFL
jgi:hypothetical protein